MMPTFPVPISQSLTIMWCATLAKKMSMLTFKCPLLRHRTTILIDMASGSRVKVASRAKELHPVKSANDASHEENLGNATLQRRSRTVWYHTGNIYSHVICMPTFEQCDGISEWYGP